MRLFIGGANNTAQSRDGSREYQDLSGDREFSAAHNPSRILPRMADPAQTNALLDSGAFSDSGKILSFDEALGRQIAWEEKASTLWESPSWKVEALVSYDTPIIEKWTNKRGERRISIKKLK